MSRVPGLVWNSGTSGEATGTAHVRLVEIRLVEIRLVEIQLVEIQLPPPGTTR